MKREATITAPDGKPILLEQTQEVGYRLDGPVLVIEGTGRDAAGKVAFNALAVVSFDAVSGTYRIRAWTAGNFVDTEICVNGPGLEWGFERGPGKVVHRMSVDAQGRWSETSEVELPDGRRMPAVKMLLSRQ